MTWKHTRSGRAVDLVNPIVETIDVETDIAIPLSLINRFDGHAGDPWQGYSVAQHCVLGAEALMAETGRPEVALAFILHDAHEAYTGGIAAPVAVALDAIAAQITRGRARNAVGDAIATMKDRLDAAIHARLGLAWPVPRDVATLVRAMDIRMLRAERDQLMVPVQRPWTRGVEQAEPIPSLGGIACWTAEHAATAWLLRLRRYMPESGREAAE
jgi:hypothetical protein